MLHKCCRNKTNTNNNGTGNNAICNNKTGNDDCRLRGMQNNIMNRNMIWQF